ncbi:MAG: glycerol kinase GlpK [Oscillospiraceae bacterium]|nr:glycerol kinase GlpK [Oscillospiraceae bacterium]
MASYVVALDQGTSSSRAILYDESGTPQASRQFEIHPHYPQPGWVEADAAEILDTELAAMKAVLSGVNPASLAAIGITNQRETTVLWDKATGRPVGRAIVWQCRRTAPICRQLIADGLEPHVRAVTGLIIDPYFSGTKIKWMLDADPTLRARACRGEVLFGTIDSWLIWNLTGGRSHVIEYSNAARTMLFDISKCCWDDTLVRALDIPPAMLPKPVTSSGVCGHLAGGLPGLEAFAGTPISGVAGDQQAALFGQCCFDAGMAKNTYGTGCFTLMNTGSERVTSFHGLLTTIGWSYDGTTTYVLEGSAFHAGSAIQWLRDELGIIDAAHTCDLLAEAPQADQGVYFVPAFSGLGAPYWDPEARGCFFGLTRGAGKSAICRAVLESIAFEVTDLIETMKLDAGIAIKQLRADGGASVSNFLMQAQADYSGVPVSRPANVESTAQGAAFLAGLGIGLWPDTAALTRMRAEQARFTPVISADERDARLRHYHTAVELSRAWGRMASDDATKL